MFQSGVYPLLLVAEGALGEARPHPGHPLPEGPPGEGVGDNVHQVHGHGPVEGVEDDVDDGVHHPRHPQQHQRRQVGLGGQVDALDLMTTLGMSSPVGSRMMMTMAGRLHRT